jgi:hypothetical protein
MKTIMLFLTGIFFSISFAQNLENKDIPQVVKDKFASSYTKTTHLKWTKEKSNYEASFRTGNKEMSVNFDEKGNIVETETEIKSSELPIEVRNSVSKDYSGYKITEAAKIESNGIITFETEVTRGKDKKDLIYDGLGVLKSKGKKDQGGNNKD